MYSKKCKTIKPLVIPSLKLAKTPARKDAKRFLRDLVTQGEDWNWMEWLTYFAQGCTGKLELHDFSQDVFKEKLLNQFYQP